MNGFIYKITNRVNNKVYIGQTHFTIEHRWKQHLKNFNIEHRKQPLYAAFTKYGIENFYIEKIEEVKCEDLDKREMYWIAYYNSFKGGYNATAGGKGSVKYIWSDNQYEEIKSLYLSGFSSTYVAKCFNVSTYTILGILRSMNVKIKRNPLDINNYETQQIIQDYKLGTSLGALANRYNTDRNTVKRFLIKNNVDLKEKSLISKDKELQQILIQDFLQGIPFKILEEKYCSDTRTIKKILVTNGVGVKKFRSRKYTKDGVLFLSIETCASILEDYNNKMLLNDIASKYDIDISTIYTLCKRHHVKGNRYNQSKSVQTQTGDAVG